MRPRGTDTDTDPDTDTTRQYTHTTQHATRNTQYASQRTTRNNTQCATRNPHHATRITQHVTRNTQSQHTTHNTEHGTRNAEHRTHNVFPTRGIANCTRCSIASLLKSRDGASLDHERGGPGGSRADGLAALTHKACNSRGGHGASAAALRQGRGAQRVLGDAGPLEKARSLVL